MDASSFKSNFIGKDGFVWWIGQIAPEEVWIKNFGISSEDDLKWGQRYKVRIMGYHPYSTAELEDKDLPWAQVLNPPGNGGSQNTGETIRLAQGDVVVGFFLDGYNAQVPMIMGAFANTPQWDRLKDVWEESGAPPSPFGVFAGYSGAMKKENYAINYSNSNDNSADSGVTNLDVSEQQANSLGVEPLTSTTGGEVNLCDKGPVAGIKQDVDDMVGKAMAFKAKLDAGNEFYRDKIKGLVSGYTKSVVMKSGGLVSSMVDNTFDRLAPLSRTGLKNLYSDVYTKIFAATKNPAIAHIAGVAAQTAMVAPLNVAENLIGCLANNIIADLGESTEGILNSVIRLSTSSIAGAVGLRGCNAPATREELGPCRYRIGYGPISSNDADLTNILGSANAAAAISNAARLTGFPLDGIQDIAGALDIFNSDMKVPGFKSSISNCYSGLPTLCEPPKIRIFGGGGEGGEAIPLFGNIIQGAKYRTGGIIDIKLTNPGNNYQFPPFVEVVDNCKQGYGATARATVKDGKINSIYIVTEGENYPVADQPELVVTNVIIVDPGDGYVDGDTVTDNFGNDYDVKIQNGAITKVTPLTSIAVDAVPNLVPNTSTGSRALLFASIDERPDDQGEVKQVIDCVS